VDGWALGVADSPRGKGELDACLSVGVRIVNRHPSHKVSLTFYLQDTKTKRKLDALSERDLLGRKFLRIPGWRDLFPPVAVDSHQEVEGHIWFMHNSRDTSTMPLDTMTIVNNIIDEEVATLEVPKFSASERQP
jgi:hypothetical protein